MIDKPKTPHQKRRALLKAAVHQNGGGNSERALATAVIVLAEEFGRIASALEKLVKHQCPDH